MVKLSFHNNLNYTPLPFFEFRKALFLMKLRADRNYILSTLVVVALITVAITFSSLQDAKDNYKSNQGNRKGLIKSFSTFETHDITPIPTKVEGIQRGNTQTVNTNTGKSNTTPSTFTYPYRKPSSFQKQKQTQSQSQSTTIQNSEPSSTSSQDSESSSETVETVNGVVEEVHSIVPTLPILP